MEEAKWKLNSSISFLSSLIRHSSRTVTLTFLYFCSRVSTQFKNKTNDFIIAIQRGLRILKVFIRDLDNFSIESISSRYTLSNYWLV